jgi:hypothetical protein
MTYACSAWEICGRHVAFEFAMAAGRTTLLTDNLRYCGVIPKFGNQVFIGQRRGK